MSFPDFDLLLLLFLLTKRNLYSSWLAWGEESKAGMREDVCRKGKRSDLVENLQFLSILFFFFLLFHPTERTEGGDSPVGLIARLFQHRHCLTHNAGPVFHTMVCNVVYGPSTYFSDLCPFVKLCLTLNMSVSFPPLPLQSHYLCLSMWSKWSQDLS